MSMLEDAINTIDLCEIKISDDKEKCDGSDDSMVLVPPSTLSHLYNTMDNNLEKMKEKSLDTIRQKYDTALEEKKALLDKSIALKEQVNQLEKDVKSDNSLRMQIVNYMNAIENIIREDETRYRLFDQSYEPSIYNFEHHSLTISFESIEITLEKLKDYIVRKLNKYYNEFREMDNRINNLNTERSNLKDIIVEKDLMMKKISKHKTEDNFDTGDQYKSLEGAERVNKRYISEIFQLKNDLKSLESENDEFQHTNRTLKKDLRTKRAEYDELQENYNDLVFEKETLEKEHKKLKKSQRKKFDDSSELEEEISKLNGKIEKYKKKLDSKNDQITTLEEEISDKNRKLNALEMSVNISKASSLIEEENDEIEQLKEKLRIMTDKMKQMTEEADKQEKEHSAILKVKETAFEKIRKKYDTALEEKTALLDESKDLEEQVNQLKNDIEKKNGAINKMKEKIKMNQQKEEELKNMKQLQMKLSSKEKDNEELTKDLRNMTQKFDDKAKEFELLKKEKMGVEKEMQNLKMLHFQKKDPEN